MTDPPRTMQAQPLLSPSLERYQDPDHYIMEKKLDGFRLVTVVDGGVEVEGYSRAMNPQWITEKLPHLTEQLRAFGTRRGRVVLDAELTTEDDDFTFVGSVMKSLSDRARRLQRDKHLQLCVFDVLEWGGESTTHLPQRARIEVLERLYRVAGALQPLPDVFLSERRAVDEAVIDEWIAAGSEGCMIKNLNRPYIPGKRPLDTWLKVKATQDADVIVTGYTEGKGKYEGMIGAVRFGQILDGKIQYRGKCSGMTDAEREWITKNQQENLGRVMVVRHMGVGTGDGFRHPIFKGFRVDKEPAECTWE